MPSPSDPRNRHHRQEQPAEEVPAAAEASSQVVPGMPASALPVGPGHHLSLEWDQGYPGARISIPAAELAADRDLIG